jgi:LuxR family maltose regulon positive regulatory protein
LDDGRAVIARGELAALRGILDLWAGNAERLVTGLTYALAVLPADAGHLRGLAHMGVAAGYWQLGDPLKAKAHLADQVAGTSTTLPLYATLLQAQGFLSWLDGDLTSLEQTAERLLRVSTELDLADQGALAHYFLGIVHYARDDLAAAERHLTLAVAARFTMRLLWWSQAAGLLALTYQGREQPEQARRTLDAAHAVLLERHALRILPNHGAFQAEVDRLQGRLADASAWAVQVEPGPLTWALAVRDPRLVQARVFLAEEPATRLDRAAALVAEVRAFCQRVPNPRLLMEIDALDALLADRQGQHEAALETLARAVLAAEAAGWVRLFVDLGDPMAGLLEQLAARRVVPHTIARILNAFPARPGAPSLPAQPGLLEPLSERELEILALLGARDSNKEIATQLFIASSTVKRHTLNIYRKLEVNDRREAVIRARELGLLSSG